MSGGTSQFGVGGGISMMGMGPVYPAESPDNGGGGEYSLPNLRPVSIGIDIFTLLSCSIASSKRMHLQRGRIELKIVTLRLSTLSSFLTPASTWCKCLNVARDFPADVYKL